MINESRPSPPSKSSPKPFQHALGPYWSGRRKGEVRTSLSVWYGLGTSLRTGWVYPSAPCWSAPWNPRSSLQSHVRTFGRSRCLYPSLLCAEIRSSCMWFITDILNIYGWINCLSLAWEQIPCLIGHSRRPKTFPQGTAVPAMENPKKVNYMLFSWLFSWTSISL